MKKAEEENLRMKRELEELKKSAKKQKMEEESQSSASTSKNISVPDDFDEWAASEEFELLSQSLTQSDMIPVKESDIKQEDKKQKDADVNKKPKSKKI